MMVPDRAIDRRRFLGFLVAGPTLTYAAVLLDGVLPPPARAEGVAVPEVADEYDLVDAFMTTGGPFSYDLLIEITPANRIRFEVPRAEVGQGVVTAAAMMLADNLDARLEDIDATMSPAEVRRRSSQFTGTSHSIRILWEPIRVIAGELRSRLATAGAHYLGVAPSTVHTEDTHVVCADGRRVPYGTISEAAARVKVPEVPPVPKPLDQLKIVGTPRSRLDARDIVTGRLRFALDLPVPDALPAVLALPRTAGATVVSVDATAARAMPGVVAVTAIPGMPTAGVLPGVAVVARTVPQALAARAALDVRWSAGPLDDVSDRELSAALHAMLEPTPPMMGEGIDAVFEWPYLAHAAMETNDAVADVRDGRAEVWTGAKAPVIALQLVAETLGLAEEQVTLHVVACGGSFGRRLFYDSPVQAAQISQRVGRAVKLLYTRGDDTRHGRTRPASVHHVRATVEHGDVTRFAHHMAAANADFRHGLGELVTASAAQQSPEAAGQFVFNLSQKMPYKVGATSLTLRERQLAVPTGSWRSVYSGPFATVNEIVIDELARLCGRDEYEYRRALLDDERARAVLDVAARQGRWGRKMPAGTAQGLGMHNEFKSIVAYLMECDVRGREPRITRVTVAVDVGRVVNPKGLKAQLWGATMDAIAVVFRAGLHLDRGRIREGADIYRQWTWMRHTPLEISVHILPPKRDLPGGAGELGFPAACAAAANAWARATGGKPRRFPINEYGG
jgi:isoquinoline 1-oxidoreductase beta subunit